MDNNENDIHRDISDDTNSDNITNNKEEDNIYKSPIDDEQIDLNEEEQIATILNLPFKDMYIRIDENTALDHQSRYNKKPGKDIDPYHCSIVPSIYNHDIHQLRIHLRKNKKDNFAIIWSNVRMRVVRLKTISKESTEFEETWCVLRRFPALLPNLDELKFPDSDLDIIKRQERRQGLIVICGGTGAGKTTTGIATFRNYLNSVGGLGYMVEDPPEYVMQGAFDKNPEQAFVLQREVTEEHEWVQAIKDGLRSNPKFVYLGEVRSPASASQMLRIANSGHLVICTVHGSSIEQGISALVQIARADQGDLGSQLLADCLSLIIYQKMTSSGPKLTLLEAKEMSDPVRQNIRDNDLKMLKGAIEQQNNEARNKVKMEKQVSQKKEEEKRRQQESRNKKGWFK